MNLLDFFLVYDYLSINTNFRVDIEGISFGSFFSPKLDFFVHAPFLHFKNC